MRVAILVPFVRTCRHTVTNGVRLHFGSGHRAGEARCFDSISEEAAEKEEAFSEFGGLSCFRLPAPILLRGWRLFNPRHNGIGS